MEQSPAPMLRLFRESLGLSQERFARLIGCSVKKIYRGERGTKTQWTPSEVKAIDMVMRDYFGKTIQDLPDDLGAISTEFPFSPLEQPESKVVQ